MSVLVHWVALPICFCNSASTASALPHDIVSRGTLVTRTSTDTATFLVTLDCRTRAIRARILTDCVLELSARPNGDFSLERLDDAAVTA